jgi:hypothetical protein
MQYYVSANVSFHRYHWNVDLLLRTNFASITIHNERGVIQKYYTLIPFFHAKVVRDL